MKDKTYILSPITLSGSTDVFRTAIGGCWETVEVVPTVPDGATQGIFPIETFGRTGDDRAANRKCIKEVLINSASTRRSDDILTPNYQLYVRVVGREEVIKDDKHWKTLLVGGQFGSTTYHPIYTASIFENTSLGYWIPYNRYEINTMTHIDYGTGMGGSTYESSPPITIKAVYNSFLPEYENYVNQLDSELLIPNIYWMRSFDIFTPDRWEHGDDIQEYQKLYSTPSLPWGGLSRFATERGLPTSPTILAEEGYMIRANYSSSIRNFVLREGNVGYEMLALPKDSNSDGTYENDNYHIYLSSSIIQNSLSASTVDTIERVHKNIFFDDQSMRGDFSILDEITSTLYDVYQDPLAANEDFEYFVNYKTRFPYYISIDIPTITTRESGDPPSPLTEPKTFREFLNNSGYIPKFLKLLKDAYADSALPTSYEDVSYLTYSDYYSPNAGNTRVSNYTTASANNLRVVDFMKLMVHGHNHFKYDASEIESCFMGPYTLPRLNALDTTGVFRYVNSVSSMSIIKDVLMWFDEHSTARPSHPSLSTIRSKITDLKSFYSPLRDIEGQRHIETLAYRIEKIGGLPTNDDRTQNVLQNIWFSNAAHQPVRDTDYSREAEPGDPVSPYGMGIDPIIHYCDTQIKYDTNYTYNIYAYVLTVGWKYKFSDLAVSRQIASPYWIDHPYLGGSRPNYCLEYYDPNTDESVASLPLPEFYSEGDFYDDTGHGDVEMSYTSYTATARADWAEFLGSTTATNAQQYSSDRYRAEYVLEYEPVIKIIEVPLCTKTLKVVDNPPNRLEINPFQIEDNSQRLGFELRYSADHVDFYPAIVATKDANIKSAYLNSRNFVEGQKISREYASRSKQKYIEVYRLDTKPKKISDFGEHLRSTLSLLLPPEEKIGKSKTIFNFYDKVKTNLKYYYVFRVINEKGMPGDLSPIYEAQLVDDGGYKFSIFNIMTEEEMKEVPFSIATPLKKIFEVLPNINHLTLNTGSVDYSQPAHTQMGNLSVGSSDIKEYIWDNTYKFRLTSKKTGRKIDLNIKYNLNSE